MIANVMQSPSTSRSSLPPNYVTDNQLTAPKRQQREINFSPVNQLKAPPRHRNLSEDTTEPIQKQENSIPNQTGLPDNLKAGVESLSGYSLDNVKVHYNSPKPAQLKALAYTQGMDIHVAPGQEKHLPHEAWHVVQQMQGRVKPTMQMKGLGVNDDEGLEQEADAMERNKIEIPTLKDQPYNSKTNGVTTRISKQGNVIQRFSILDYLAGKMSEDEKDHYCFIRSNYNPLNWFAQIHNEAYERGNTAYHSTSVHGAQNTLSNIRDRHFSNPGGPRPMSLMLNTLTGVRGNIRKQKYSSRFNSSSWEKHARNDAINLFSSRARTAGFAVTWQNVPPPFGAPGVGNSTSQFYITYSNPYFGNYDVGITSQHTGMGQVGPSQVTNVVKVTINYYQNGLNQLTAWIGQMFPVPAAAANTNTGPVIMGNSQSTAWSFSDFNPLQ
ncbi:MAG: DUF4157 domain-containing protein [Okeania sp. SIO2G4]|nr:DUF4157 domain-containing protein [Okeania sp. SIO2G5]NEP92611.1 DUF4157 domain-containing protein [Okeania sp. SIO2F5]NEQ90060.1 DUF4157 domain-containing protein [Okeania sp. SIO2G4]